MDTRPFLYLYIHHKYTYKIIKDSLLANSSFMNKTRSVAAGFSRHGMPPPACNDTGTTFPELNRDRDETYRRCEFVTLTFDLETGAQCSTCRGVPSCQCWWYYDHGRLYKCYYTDVHATTIRCRFMGYWGWARISSRVETSSLSFDHLQQQMLLLIRRELTNNCFSATKF